MSYYRQQLEDWLKTLDVKCHTVLDIGGAQGEVKSRVKSWDVKRYWIGDTQSQVGKLARNSKNYDENYTETKYVVMDMNYPNTDAVHSGYYDDIAPNIIFCLEVFEYLYNPLIAMKNMEQCLVTHGKIYATFPFVYPHHNELELDSLRYTETGIKRLAEAAGLCVTNTWYRRDKSGLLQSFYATDGMRMAKQYPNHDVTGFIVEFKKK